MDDQQRKAAGVAAEEFALTWLRGKGLKLVTRNYRCRAGEIDLVMMDNATLALIEVRFRSGDSFGGAAASVTPTKQKRLILAARHLLVARAELKRYPARFDVIAMGSHAPGPEDIKWIKAAFTL